MIAVMLGLNWQLSIEVKFSCAAINKIANVCPFDKGSFLTAISNTVEFNKIHSDKPNQTGKTAKGAITKLKIGP